MVPGEPRRPHSRKTVQSPNMLESHGEAVASTIAEAAGRAPDDATVRAAMEVDAAYLKASLHAIEAERGSVDAYLNTVLGVGPAVRDAILNPHLLAVTMKGNGTDLEFDIELDLVDKTAEIAFRHERDQDIWDPVQTGSER